MARQRRAVIESSDEEGEAPSGRSVSQPSQATSPRRARTQPVPKKNRAAQDRPGPSRRRSESPGSGSGDGEEDADEDVVNALSQDISHYILLRMPKDGHVKEADIRKAFGSQSTTVNVKAAILKSVQTIKDTLDFKVVRDKGVICFYNKNAPPKSLTAYPQNIANRKKEAKDGLLTTILTFLFMKSPQFDKVPETALMEFLETLDIGPGKNGGAFGDIAKLIGPASTAEFVARGYLEVTKEATDRGIDTYYSWGVAAKNNVDPMLCLRMFCDVNEVTRPRLWTNHYEAAQEWRRAHDVSDDEREEQPEGEEAEADENNDVSMEGN